MFKAVQPIRGEVRGRDGRCSAEEDDGKRRGGRGSRQDGRRDVLPSSSKCVSTPDGPGTEHTSRAFRKVVQRLIRLLFPPTSFCSRGNMVEVI